MKRAERAEAISLGLMYYYTGKPCKNGHLSKRYTSNCICYECHKEHRAAWEAANPGYHAAWEAANPDKIRARSAAYRAANPDKVRKKNAAWIAANPTYHKDWAVANRDKRRASWHRRNARKLSAGGSFTAAEFAEVCARQKSRCFYCGKKAKLEADHYEPISRGGSNSIENIRGACRDCNVRKCAKHPVDFAIERGFLCF